MLRDSLAAVIGIVVAFITVMLVEMFGHVLYPPPGDLNVEDMQAMARYVSTLPVGAVIIVLAAYVIAAFVGTLVACLIGRAKPFIYALVVGILMLVATISNVIMIPHPMWFSISAVVGIIVAAWLASLFAASVLAPRT